VIWGAFKKINNAFLYVKVYFKILSISLSTLFFAIFLFFSAISYNPIDLIETGGNINIFGIIGANVANFFLQYFGLATYFIIIILLRISFLIALNGEIFRYKTKFLGLFFALLFCTFLLSSFKKYEFAFYTPIGGYIGFLLTENLSKTPFFIPLIIFFSIFFVIFTIFCLELQNTILWKKIFTKVKSNNVKENKIINPSPSKNPIKSTPKESASVKKPTEMPNLVSKINASLRYIPPAISLLSLNNTENQKKNAKNLSLTKQTEKELYKALADYGIEATIKGARVGPVITMYEIEPKAGIRAARIIGLSEDIARSLKAKSARISLIPSSSHLAIEIPNAERETVFLRELLDSVEFKEAEFNIPIALGKSIAGDNIIVDLVSMPHLLVAGTTGSGKSVGVNAMILSILYKLSPNDCQFIMIDPKMLELSVYNDIPHLITPVITESERAVLALKWLTLEMERRYKKMSAFSVRNIFGYNEEILKLKTSGIVESSETSPFANKEELQDIKKMPFIVVVIDEMADLMITAGKVIEGYIQRLAQMARAAGIHVIMATQRPSVDVITGVIKANFPTRISYQVSSKIDSRTIIGASGAEGLLGKGDMLYMQAGTKMYRIHAPFVSDTEVNNIVSMLKKTYGGTYDNLKADIFQEVLEEDAPTRSSSTESIAEKGKNEEGLYAEAVEIVVGENKPSISYIQRRLKIGYNKAANLIERMESEGILSPVDQVNGRRIILKK
jgi:S-DNA-T family DNA segregation ATPase FtsK/SpoIIIE